MFFQEVVVKNIVPVLGMVLDTPGAHSSAMAAVDGGCR